MFFLTVDDLVNAISASLGGIVSTFTLYPIEVVKNNLQVSTGQEDTTTNKAPTFFTVANSIYKNNGPLGFFAGVKGSCASAALEKFFYYYMYSNFVRQTRATSGPTLLFCGYVADFSHLPITMIFEKIMIAQQTAAKDGITISFFPEFQRLLKKGGWQSFYSGWHAYFILAFKPAIENMLFDLMKRFALRGRNVLSGAQAFVLGAIARGVATLIAYPAYRALRISQKNGQDQSIVSVLTNLVREKGWSGLYQGIVPDISRGVLSSALRTSIKESLSSGVRKLLLPQQS